MDYHEMEEKYVAHTYGRLPITLVEGDGVKVYDDDGKEYLDFLAGIAVCSLGHSNPDVLEALDEQAGKLVHVSNFFYIPTQMELAKKLAEVAPADIQKFFFCNSGTEAVEAALKLAFKHTDRHRIIALEGSFHGRTPGALALTWEKKYRKPFKGLIYEGAKFAPRNDLEAVKDLVDEDTAAIIAETVQGEGGINVLSDDFILGLREICDDEGCVLVFDEVQSGMCRTGKWFACQHWDVQPDIITMAKALGNGFPIGSMGATEEVADSFTPGDHASTFGGNPLACAVAGKVVDIMREEDVPRHVEKVGGYFKRELERISEDRDSVVDVRGLGLMLAMELDDEEDAKFAFNKALEDGFLINRTAGTVLRFVPPLIVEEEHVDRVVEEMDEILGEIDGE